MVRGLRRISPIQLSLHLRQGFSQNLELIREPAGPRNPLVSVSTPQCLDYRLRSDHTQLFTMLAGDSNSSLHTYPANTAIPPSSSPQPRK